MTVFSLSTLEMLLEQQLLSCSTSLSLLVSMIGLEFAFSYDVLNPMVFCTYIQFTTTILRVFIREPRVLVKHAWFIVLSAIDSPA